MKNKSLLTLAAALLATSAITGCTRVVTDEIADRVAHPAWMQKRVVAAGPFALTTYERMHERGTTADIYIEGDGKAWLSKSVASANPTPVNPVALHLATRDKADNVAWIARPCQYSGMTDENEVCNSDYWKGKRFNIAVLESFNATLDDIKARYDITGFNLVGYSGGGAVAAILSAQREDVLSFRTVAGNLDHKAHTTLHKVSPLTASMNPPDFVAKLRTVPQVHFIGGQDTNVPPAILQSYLQALGPSNCVQYQLIQEAAHDKGWVDKWPELLAVTPACTGAPAPAYDFMPLPEQIFTAPEKPEKP